MAQPVDSAAPQFGNDGSMIPTGMNAVTEAQNTTTTSQQVTSQHLPATTTEIRTFSQTTTQGAPVVEMTSSGQNYYGTGSAATHHGASSYQASASTAGYAVGSSAGYPVGSSAGYPVGSTAGYQAGSMVAGYQAGSMVAAGPPQLAQNAATYNQTSYNVVGGTSYPATSNPAVYSTAGEISYSQAGQSTSQGVYSSSQVIRGTSGVTEHSRVIGHEYGQERVVSVTEHVDESRASVISERYVEYEVKVPKKIVREEMIEKVIVRMEPVRLEETIEEVQKVREKIVEVAKPTIVEKVVEIPEIEWIERIIEVPGDREVREKLVHKDVVHYEDRVHHVQKVIKDEKEREVPEYIYRDVPVERIVEIVEHREEVIIREVPVPQQVDKPIRQEVQVEKFIDLERKIPVPVEAIVAYEYRMPRIKPRYSKVTYPVYLPRFIEIPVAVDLLNAGLLSHAENYLNQVQSLTRSATSLCEIEGLAAQIMKADLQAQLQSVDLQAAVLKAWQTNTIQTTSSSMTTSYGAAATTNYAAAATTNYAAGATTNYAAYSTGGPAYATTTMAPFVGNAAAAGGMVSVTREHKKSKKSSKNRA